MFHDFILQIYITLYYTYELKVGIFVLMVLKANGPPLVAISCRAFEIAADNFLSLIFWFIGASRELT